MHDASMASESIFQTDNNATTGKIAFVSPQTVSLADKHAKEDFVTRCAAVPQAVVQPRSDLSSIFARHVYSYSSFVFYKLNRSYNFDCLSGCSYVKAKEKVGISDEWSKSDLVGHEYMYGRFSQSPFSDK